MQTVKTALQEFRNKILFRFLQGGEAPCTFAYNQTIQANATGSFVVPVPQSFLFLPQYIAVKSTGEFQITSIQIDQQNLHYGDPISSLILTQYSAYPLQWTAFIGAKVTLMINLKDVSGAANAVKILLTGKSYPAI